MRRRADRQKEKIAILDPIRQRPYCVRRDLPRLQPVIATTSACGRRFPLQTPNLFEKTGLGACPSNQADAAGDK